MRKRINLTALLLLLVTSFCHARALTLAEADTIIYILLFVVIVLVVLGSISLYYNRVISRRNEQLLRILDALDDYRALVSDGTLTLDEQEEILKRYQPKKTNKSVKKDGSRAFYVKMDARVNKEKPFTNPDFNQESLAEFMEVDLETFRKLVPRYEDPDRTLDYINSLRAEYAAKILMEHSDCSMDDMPRKCGFKNSTAFLSAFKFAFGITPTDYLNSMNLMFKKKGAS